MSSKAPAQRVGFLGAVCRTAGRPAQRPMCAGAHRLVGSRSCRRASSRAGLGAGPGARLNVEGRFSCHSQLAALPLSPSSLNREGHAAQHRVRGRGWGESAGRPRYPEGGAGLAEAAARSGTLVSREDRVIGTCVCTGTQSCVVQRLRSCALLGEAVSDTPQGKVVRVGVPDAPVWSLLVFSLAW